MLQAARDPFGTLRSEFKPRSARVQQPSDLNVRTEPFYQPLADEVEVFERSYRLGLPLLLKGPTGCGKTRFVEYMAHRLGRPLITVSCHDDLTTSDLVGRFLVRGEETIWNDGPLTRAVRMGAICYLDEVVEARKDTTVVIHPLCDDRRLLPVEKLGEYLEAPPEFGLVISYNPGYQSILKELKPSTRQRFVALAFDYPEAPVEAEIIARESGCAPTLAGQLVQFAHLTRNLKGNGLDEGASTRLLVHAAKLSVAGTPVWRACRGAVAEALTDDPEVLEAIADLVASVFGDPTDGG